MDILLTLVLGIIGGLTFYKLKFPAGAMVGSMLAVAIYSVVTGQAAMPSNLRLVTQMMAGAYIGSSIQYKDVMLLKRIFLPAFLMIFMMISLDVFMGFILAQVSELSLPTALMVCAPGGLMDITLISADVGANSSQVAVLQLLRLMTVMSFFPLLMKRIAQRTQKEAVQEVAITQEDKERLRNNWFLSKQQGLNLGATLIIAVGFGILGYFLGIPAGGMTFAMISVAILNIGTGRGYLPMPLRRATQILAGTLMGVRMTYADLVGLRTMIVPAALLIMGIIIINLIVGFFLNKLTKIGLITSLLSSVPGGVSDMALIAGELGGDQNKVAILQLFRYVFVVAAYPVIIRTLVHFIGY